ncbi:hypothetical protein B0A48_18598 [Cryoendolithus antarcticus]|uniref:C3H1-type domain-containing protein n=1 Tax=Cryoendolithus antarcticus TaxID=1507870 RepID=A0A1V8S860_9PEZI|nr:hypothetical protein B0A48_18598 [Cryoendolithus antarcticus]
MVANWAFSILQAFKPLPPTPSPINPPPNIPSPETQHRALSYTKQSVTCFYWARGGCQKSDVNCQKASCAHHPTAIVADRPSAFGHPSKPNSTVMQRWIMIIDNAVKLDCGVKTILPQGHAGSVIVTSQDSHASQMLGRDSQVVRVEEMSVDDARTLLLSAVSEDLRSASEELLSTTTQLVDTLDRLALAVDLAGARIGSDVDEGAKAHDAMQRYLADFQRHPDRLLPGRKYAEATEYD